MGAYRKTVSLVPNLYTMKRRFWHTSHPVLKDRTTPKALILTLRGISALESCHNVDCMFSLSSNYNATLACKGPNPKVGSTSSQNVSSATILGSTALAGRLHILKSQVKLQFKLQCKLLTFVASSWQIRLAKDLDSITKPSSHNRQIVPPERRPNRPL